MMEDVKGADTEGNSYKNICDMWTQELADEEKRKRWYEKASAHWQEQEASLTGILGGYPETNGPDLRESRRFLELVQQKPNPPEFGRVLDCGAGIGRVSSGLLLPEFRTVDLVEPNQRLLDVARREITDPRAERFIRSSLQTFEPEIGRYDAIWAQWVLLYLPDDDLVRFLERCKAGLRNEQSMIFVKENVVIEGQWLVDKEDNSISRTDAQYKAIFRKAGLCLLHEMRQASWPSDLIPVKMYALRPAEANLPERSEVTAPSRTARPAVRKKPAASR